jgi:hypothetical protein
MEELTITLAGLMKNHKHDGLRWRCRNNKNSKKHDGSNNHRYDGVEIMIMAFQQDIISVPSSINSHASDLELRGIEEDIKVVVDYTTRDYTRKEKMAIK